MNTGADALHKDIGRTAGLELSGSRYCDPKPSQDPSRHDPDGNPACSGKADRQGEAQIISIHVPVQQSVLCPYGNTGHGNDIIHGRHFHLQMVLLS